MNTSFPIYHPQFFTATILDWKHLLGNDKYKDIIVNSLRYLVNEKRISLYGFVIMSNHIHLIWHPLFVHSPADVQSSFMKFTGNNLKKSVLENDPEQLEEFKVNKYDRNFQIWKREPLSVELRTHEVFIQKLDYIHQNPVRAGLCLHPEDYHYSSAKFYNGGTDDFGVLTHYTGN